jgi:hypothetical protein
MVADIKPLCLPVFVRLNQFLAQVPVGGVFTHLDVGTSDYSWVVGTRQWLQPEEFAKQDLVGLDTQASQK